MSFYRSRIAGVVTMGVALALVVVGCSSGGETAATGGTDTADTAVAITSIDQLPKATSPVTSSSSGSLSALSLQALATTGMPFGGDNVATFSSGDSVAACGMYNLTREAIGSAAEGDLILCYIQNIITANLATILATGEDPYDGNFHVVNLDFGQGQQQQQGGPSKVRMKIVKDASGNITQFVMYACNESDAQEMYLNQAISGTSFSMTSKGTFSDTNFSGSYQTDVTGTLNSSGLFTGTKTITNSHSATNNSTTDLNWGEATMLQTSSAFTTSAYSKGAFTDTQSGFAGTYTDRVYSQGQIIDPNTGAVYDLGSLALGDGAINGTFVGSFTMGQNSMTWSDTVTESWDGDTQLAVASNDFTSAAAAGTPPTAAESAPTISFSGAEVYDCSDTATVTVTVDQPSLDSSCSNLDLGHGWIDCWTETGQNTESAGPAQASCTTDQQCKDYLESVVGDELEQPAATLAATTCTEASGACALNCAALDGASCATMMESGGIGAECDGSFACTFPFAE